MSNPATTLMRVLAEADRGFVWVPSVWAAMRSRVIRSVDAMSRANDAVC
jgi:hypothetical protein